MKTRSAKVCAKPAAVPGGVWGWHRAKGHPEATKQQEQDAQCSWSILLAHPRRRRELLAPATESVQDAPWQDEGTWPRVLGTP